MNEIRCDIRHPFILYLYRLGVALSVLFNVMLGGPSNQMFSARNYQWKKNGQWNIVWLIDRLVWFEDDHCMMTWLYWRTRKDIDLLHQSQIAAATPPTPANVLYYVDHLNYDTQYQH